MTEVSLFTQVDLTDRIDLVGNPPLSLPRYDDEVDEIIARAEAIRAYTKQARNRQLEFDAAEIRIRAERRVGELMAAQAETVGKATGTAGLGRPAKGGLGINPPNEGPPTLAETGIDKNLAHHVHGGGTGRRASIDPCAISRMSPFSGYSGHPPQPAASAGGVAVAARSTGTSAGFPNNPAASQQCRS